MTVSSSVIIRISMIYLSLIIPVYFQNWKIWALADDKIPVCITPECIKLGKMLKNNMNENGRPCIDFYDYACHNWIKQNPRPKYISNWHAGVLLEEKAYENLRKLVEDKKISNITDEEYAKALYRRCMNTPHMERSDAETITLNLGEWPLLYPKNKEPQFNTPTWLIDKQYIQLTGESALFYFAIEVDEFKPSEFTTLLHYPFSPYGALTRQNSWLNKREREHYKSFLNKIIRKVAPRNVNLSENAINYDLEQVIKFREDLRQIIHVTKEEKFFRSTIRSLQEWYDKDIKREKYDWLQIIRAIHKTPEDPRGSKITPESVIYIQEDYFVVLENLLFSIPRRVIVNHIHLYFIERHLELDPSLIIELKESVTVGGGGTATIRYNQPRWKRCLKANNMERVLGSMYVKSFFPEENRKAVKQLFDEAKNLLKEQIADSSWLDFPTAFKTFNKIKDMRDVIGVPITNLKNSEIKAIAEYMKPMKVNAVYITEWNLLSATAAYLQPPVYTPNVPYVIDYGITVNAFGHELNHAFDTTGVNYDGNGNKSPWSAPMLAKYNNQTECFVRHYEKFVGTEFKKHDMCANKECPFTLNEDLADSMGLKLAYKGFDLKLKETKGVCPVLPGFDKLGCKKLFFIAFANNMCAAPKTSSHEAGLLEDEHSAARIRINAVVANMPEFAEAFNCKPNDPLTAKQSCDIWKK